MKYYLLLILLTKLTCYAQDSQLSKVDSIAKEGNYEVAYNAYKEISETYYANDKIKEYAETHLHMIDMQLQQGNFFQAKSLAENTIAFINESLSGKDDLLARCKTLLGLSYLSLGRNDDALAELREAESLFAQESEAKGDCYDALGLVYTNNENVELATQYLERGLRLRRQLFGSRSIQVGNSFNNLGRVYLTEDPLQAIIYFNRAKDIYETSLGTDSRRTLRAKLNIAYAYMEQENYEEAINLLDEVKKTYETSYGKQNSNVAFIQSIIGRVQLLQESYESALVNQNEALQLYISLFGEKHPEVANTYYLIGEVYKARTDFKLAVGFYQQAIYANLPGQAPTSDYSLPQLTNYFNPDVLLTSLQAKAIALEALHYQKTLNVKDLTGAVDTYVKCDELITIIRRKRLNEKDKLRLGRIAREVYESGIQLSLNLSEQSLNRKRHLQRAFEFCERSKSSVLLEAITESKAKEFAGIPSELLQLEDSLKDEISYLEQQLAAAETEQEASIKNLLFTYQNSYREFVSKLESDYPNYFDLKYSQQVVSIERIQAKLNDFTSLLSYFIGDEEIFVFIINKKGMSYERKPKIEQFDRLPKGFRNAIKYNIQSSYIRSAKSLYEQLIPKLPTSTAEIVILPDGALGTIPFEALIRPDDEEQAYSKIRFLIRDYHISYDYSATLFAGREASLNQETPQILLLAPVSFQDNDIRMASLPGSEKEIDEIKYLFMGNNCEPKVQMGSTASESNFKNESLENYQYVHFATHGIVNESEPALSRIFLTPGENQDGSLYTGEIYNLKINADLVTLSACETGLGKIEKGEGIVGLSRALQYAGANNIIVSLWQVADASTADMMIEFYKYNLNNPHHGYNTALRTAKLSLINSDDYAKPYYWAPFILVGI